MTVEEGAVGGFATQVVHFLAREGLLESGIKLRPLCLPDFFIDHGKPDNQYALAGLDAENIVNTALQALGYNEAAAVSPKLA